MTKLYKFDKETSVLVVTNSPIEQETKYPSQGKMLFIGWKAFPDYEKPLPKYYINILFKSVYPKLIPHSWIYSSNLKKREKTFFYQKMRSVFTNLHILTCFMLFNLKNDKLLGVKVNFCIIDIE